MFYLLTEVTCNENFAQKTPKEGTSGVISKMLEKVLNKAIQIGHNHRKNLADFQVDTRSDRIKQFSVFASLAASDIEIQNIKTDLKY